MREELISVVAGLCLLLPVTSRAAPLAGRTLAVAVEVDRDGARLLSYTLKGRPFDTAAEKPGSTEAADELEVALVAGKEVQHRRVVALHGLCLQHAPDAAPHIQGDTIQLHRDSFIVELPELKGADKIEIAHHTRTPTGLVRRLLKAETLDAARFLPATDGFRYQDLLFAVPGARSESPVTPSVTTGRVWWPEDFGDTDLYTVYGNASEVSNRINVVIVPDGYRFADKTTMQTHASNVVAHFRGKTPFKEHDGFFNYILVYAYSTTNGTDQCDCAITNDTAMGTYFPNSTPSCGHSDNRCLYYGTGCDKNSSANIAAAELRAPAKDVTLIMVNTTRYGGCGGSRATYAAGNSSAREIAVHELGHSLGGLADEYAYDNLCGSSAGEINTSKNSTNGAWAEWIADIGAPRVGAQYYQQCLYRPLNDCEMRNLNVAFCPVCNQQWARKIFSHARVHPTAPIQSRSLPATFSVGTNAATFNVATRLPSGTGVTNLLNWTLTGTGYPVPTLIATNTNTLVWSFAPGDYTLNCEVIASYNFVKPSKTSSNRDLVAWRINVASVTATTLLAVATEDGAATGRVMFVRQGSTEAALPVSYAIAGTASNGLDFAPLTNAFTFATGAATTLVNVVALPDALTEPLETVQFILATNAAYSIAQPSQATVTIAASLYDHWRQTEFTVTELADAAISGDNADPDGDGQSNLAEFIAGTKPKDAGSLLRILTVQSAGGSAVQLAFPSVTGKRYRLDRCTDLLAGDWQMLQDNITGTGDFIQVTDAAGLSAERRFYRVYVYP